MRFKTKLQIRTSTVEKINRIFRETKYRWFHANEINKKLQEQVWTDERYRRLPQYEHSYLRGYIDALYDQLWTSVMWVFPWAGKIYDSWAHLPEDGKAFFREPHNLGFHVYKDSRDICFTGNQEVFDLLLAGSVEGIVRADQINKEERGE